MKMVWTLMAAAGLIALFAGSLVIPDGDSPVLLAGEEKAAGDKGGDKGNAKSPPYKTVAPTLVVMENVDEVFSRLYKNIGKKEIKKIKKDAQFLAELTNVIRYYKVEKDWADWAWKCRDQFVDLAAKCEKADVKTMKAAVNSIDDTCSACHDKYRDK